MPRRRPLVTALVTLILAFALPAVGCGGSSKPAGPDPNAEALGYVPRAAPLALVVATDTHGKQGAALQALAEQIPGADVGLTELAARIGLDFDRDVRPVLGHDIVISLPDRQAVSRRGGLLLSAVAGNEQRLQSAVSSHVADGTWRGAGSYRGARLYRSLRAVAGRRPAVAVRGSVLLLSDNAAVLRRALDLRAQRAGLTPTALRERIGNLPPDALVRVVGDARALLAAGRHTRALKVPWVSALRQFAATIQVTDGGLQARVRIATDPAGLTTADVPLATGLLSPTPAGNAPLVVGIRDASHVIAFAQRVGNVLEPDKLRALEAGKALLRLIGGVDLDEDLVRQFPGTTTVLSDLRHFTVRADARDPGALRKALDRIQPLTGRLLDGIGLSDADVDEQSGVYRVRRFGRTIARYAAIGSAFVVTTDPRAKLAAVAAARPATTTPQRRGALTLQLKGTAIQDVLIRLLHLPPIAKLALAPLQGATGAVRAERDRLEGTLDVRISG